VCSSARIMRYAQQLGGVLTAKAMRTAAHSRNLPLCEYLLAEGCPWGADACTFAAYTGKLYEVRWLRDNGCPCDVDKLLLFAAARGSLNVMQYMQQQPGVVFTVALLTDMLTLLVHAASWQQRSGCGSKALSGPLC
jgi:hypothetical protein